MLIKSTITPEMETATQEFTTHARSKKTKDHMIEPEMTTKSEKPEFAPVEFAPVEFAQAEFSQRRRRQMVAMAIGAACLVAAGKVAAEDAAAPDPQSIDSKTAQAKNFIDKMSSMVSDGFSELEEARKSQNINRVNCVNDALTTMNGLKRLADSNYTALQECSSRKDADCAEHEYVKVSIAFNKAEELSGQLKGCGGPSVDGTIDGKPYIEKDFSNDLPQINPTAGLTDLASPIEIPPSASPFFKPSSP